MKKVFIALFDRQSLKYLSIVIIIAIIFAVPYFDVQMGDAVTYLLSAHNFIHGYAIPWGTFGLRWGYWIWLALGMIFGLGIKQLVWITTVQFIMLIVIVFGTASLLRNKKVGLMAVLFMVCTGVFLGGAGKIMTDVAVAVLITSAMGSYFFFILKKDTYKLNPKKWGALFAIVIFCAFFTKESTAFIAPFVLFSIVRDWKSVELRTFWITVFLTWMTCIGMIILARPPFFENPAAYVNIIANNNMINYSIRPTWFELFKHAPLGIFGMFDDDYSTKVSLLLSMFYLATPTTTQTHRLLKQYIVLLFIGWCLWIIIQDFTFWNFTQLQPRVWLPVFIPMIIGSMALVDIFKKEPLYVKLRVRYIAIAVVFVMVSFAVSLNNSTLTEDLLGDAAFVMLGVIFFSIYHFSKKTKPVAFVIVRMSGLVNRMGVFFFCLILILFMGQVIHTVFVFATGGPFREYEDQKEIITTIKSKHRLIMIYGSSVGRNGIYNNFLKDGQFVDYSGLSRPVPGGLLLLERWDLDAIRTKTNISNYPDFVLYPKKYGAVVCYERKDYGTIVYQFPETSTLASY